MANDTRTHSAYATLDEGEQARAGQPVVVVLRRASSIHSSRQRAKYTLDGKGFRSSIASRSTEGAQELGAAEQYCRHRAKISDSTQFTVL